MSWTEKYKKSIDCNNPKGFSQRAHCLGKKKKIKEGTLHKWFNSSKSKDGKPGWVNVVTGGTCASDEPGEGVPKCVSSAKRASMTKAERLSASRRKKVADPGQQEKSGASKPTYVSTDSKKKMNEAKKYPDHEHSMIRSELQTIRKAVDRLKKKMKGEGNVEAWVQSKITKAADYIDSAADYVDSGEHNVHGSMDEQKDVKGKGSGKKDACYRKVKARYDVWPSAYASGALVKCRKVGAANWGNKTESYGFSNWRDDFKALEIESINLIEPEKIKGGQQIGEKCWDGYTQKGMKKKGKKVVPNCVPVGEQKHTPTKSDLESNIGGGNLKKLASKAAKRIDYDVDGDVDSRDEVEKKTGEYGEELPTPFGKFRTGNSKNVKVKKENFSNWRQELGEDWQKVNRQDETDGMSQKAVNAYRLENPGSKLKTAVTEKDPGPERSKRRKSFCARSKGQQDMHNIDCSKDPEKAICKARRRWRC